MTRRGIAGAAASLLFALVLVEQPWAEIPRRARFLAAFAPKEAALRRLGGSGTAFDRRYFEFLENVRRRIPPGTRGIALKDIPGEPGLYLAAYVLAPLPVSAGPFGGVVPPRGWVTALYGWSPPSDAGVLARVPGGVLLGPSPGPNP